MTALTIITTVLGLLLVPVLDPETRRWIQARYRLRAVRAASEAYYLRKRIEVHERRALKHADRGLLASEKSEAASAEVLRAKLRAFDTD